MGPALSGGGAMAQLSSINGSPHTDVNGQTEEPNTLIVVLDKLALFGYHPGGGQYNMERRPGLVSCQALPVDKRNISPA